MYADLFLRPTVVKSCAADSDFFSGERDGDCHRHIVVRVQSFRVVNDVCVLELDFLHLGVLFRFLIDNLTFYGLESTGSAGLHIPGLCYLGTSVCSRIVYGSDISGG